METRQLGNSDMRITPIGLGTWAIGGEWLYGWGPQDDKASIETINRALDLGINWIDTAAIYGLGRSESVIGSALKSRSQKPYIFTKCSMVWDQAGAVERSMKSNSIRRELEDSLRRLQVDVIDLYQIHWPIPEEDIEEGWATLAELRDEGKVRYIGVSNFSVEQMQRAQTVAPMTSSQPPYSLIQRNAEEHIMPYCIENNIGVIVYSPMQSGLLTGAMNHERLEDMPKDDWRLGNSHFQEPHFTRNLRIADFLVQMGKEYGRTAAEIALAWVLANPAVTGAIVGARKPEQVDGFIGAGDYRLSEEDLGRIGDFVQQV